SEPATGRRPEPIEEQSPPHPNPLPSGERGPEGGGAAGGPGVASALRVPRYAPGDGVSSCGAGAGKRHWTGIDRRIASHVRPPPDGPMPKPSRRRNVAPDPGPPPMIAEAGPVA